ncbi:DUF2933 domain-containing protein [Algiphilus aromaticivorans]|jgi:hypothetical protein|uniref:DUF2933 domain-containing protein n=1 Tax=Algiphilus aromaticivorans TaxID=382454 RepID=UPI000694B98C|nr:DUF2933 domain-containing protein [Algiphilus aromaticivorans]
MSTHRHDSSPYEQRQVKPHPARFWPVLAIFLGLALFLLWEEHQAHILGALPWLLILVLCPLMHVFMHGGHGHGSHGEGNDRQRQDGED